VDWSTIRPQIKNAVKLKKHRCTIDATKYYFSNRVVSVAP